MVYTVHAFNARGQQLSHHTLMLDRPGMQYQYSETFARTMEYDTAVWATSRVAGYASGYVYRDGGYVRNRIAYFELCYNAVLLTRITRESDGFLALRPVVGYGEGTRGGDPRYTVTAEGTGARPHAQYVARFCGEWIGAHDDAHEAYAACRTHHAHRLGLPEPIGNGVAVLAVEPSATPGWNGDTWSSPLVAIGPDPAQAAYRAMMADPFGPTDPFAQSDAEAVATVRQAFAPADPSDALSDAVRAVLDTHWADALTEFRDMDYPDEGSFLFGSLCALRNALDGAELDTADYSDQAEPSSQKFGSALAERLYAYDANGFSDHTLGTSEGFGYRAWFPNESAILSVDSQGFVMAFQATAWTWEIETRAYEAYLMRVVEDGLPTGECDGALLIFDTARHNGFTPNRDDVMDHLDDCATCAPFRYVLDES